VRYINLHFTYFFFCCLVPQNSLSSVDGLIKKHDGFTTTLEAQREKITTLEQLCQALLAQEHYASEHIKSRCDGVVDRMGRVVQMTESRRLKLLDSRSYQQFLCNIYEVLKFCFFLVLQPTNHSTHSPLVRKKEHVHEWPTFWTHKRLFWAAPLANMCQHTLVGRHLLVIWQQL